MPFKKLIDPLKRVLERKPPASSPKSGPAHAAPEYLPPEIADIVDESAPAGSYYDYAVITGTDESPDGRLGAYALANGKSGDVKRWPLPRDPASPKARWFENGTACILKSIGPESKVVEFPDRPRGDNLFHFAFQDVSDKTKAKERPSPTKGFAPRTDVSTLPKPVEINRPELMEDLVEDVYDPRFRPKREGGLRVRAKKPSALDGPKDMTGLRLGHLGRVRDLDVVLVDGQKVRDESDVDFTMGGNPARYGYVPPGEVWVEKALNATDRIATIIHEVAEYHRMTKRHESYEEAHEAAARLESEFRAQLLQGEVDEVDTCDAAAEFLQRHEDETEVELGKYENKAQRKQHASVTVRRQTSIR